MFLFKKSDKRPAGIKIKIRVILILTILSALIIYIPYNIYINTENEVSLHNNIWPAASKFLFIILLKTCLVVILIIIATALLVWYLNKIYKDVQLNKELIESKDKYRQLIEYASDGIYYSDFKGRILFANNGTCEMLGYTSEEITSISILDTYLPEERDIAKERLQNADNGKKLKFVRKMIKKNGTTLDAEISVSLLPDGTHQIIAHDITSRLKAEEALKESEERFKEIADLLPQTIFETDLKGDMKYVNLAGKLIFGYNADYPTDELNIYDILVESDRRKARENIQKLLRGGRRNGTEYTGLKKDGTEIPVVVYTTPIMKKNQLIGLRGLVIDNTERKEFEKQIILAKEKAEEMNRLKSNFLANMSHELRTPMIGILGYSEILKTELETVELKDMAETIHLSARRLLGTLNQLLDLSRIESNKFEIKTEPLNINNELAGIIRSFEGAAGNKGLYLKFNAIDNGIHSILDRGIFEKIMNNLLNNAIKFTNTGGVTVEVKRGIKENTKCGIIKVMDTGIGIKKENQDIIFEEFRQVSEGLSRKYEGTGLGLTITKKSIELMNGRIVVESEPGEGSTFTICFAETYGD
jgi:PAS domain S-box-containing protein